MEIEGRGGGKEVGVRFRFRVLKGVSPVHIKYRSEFKTFKAQAVHETYRLRT